MTAAEVKDQQPQGNTTNIKDGLADRKIIAEKVTGVVKWFNVRNGYGFINRDDTQEDIFIHQTAIIKNNPQKFFRSVGDGEAVVFDVVVGLKGNEAANVTGPNGDPVQGSIYAPDRSRNYRRGGFRGGRGRARFFNRTRRTTNESSGPEEEKGAGDERGYRGRGGRGGYFRGGGFQRGAMFRGGPPGPGGRGMGGGMRGLPPFRGGYGPPPPPPRYYREDFVMGFNGMMPPRGGGPPFRGGFRGAPMPMPPPRGFFRGGRGGFFRGPPPPPPPSFFEGPPAFYAGPPPPRGFLRGGGRGRGGFPRGRGGFKKGPLMSDGASET